MLCGLTAHLVTQGVSCGKRTNKASPSLTSFSCLFDNNFMCLQYILMAFLLEYNHKCLFLPSDLSVYMTQGHNQFTLKVT